MVAPRIADPGSTMSCVDRGSERAAALYGARLGLRHGARPHPPGVGAIDVFPAAVLIVEVVRRPVAGGPGPRQIMGLDLARRDIDAARERLIAADRGHRGADRPQARNRVMSLRSGTCGVHTLLLERTAKAELEQLQPPGR